MLEDPEWSQWPAREIARQCRVSNTFVSKLKKDLSVNDAQIDGTSLVTCGGKTFPMDTTNIGRKGSDDGGASDGDGDHGDDAPGSGSADPDAAEPQPHEEITGPSGPEDVSDDDKVDGDLVGALDDILAEVRGGGGDDDEEMGGTTDSTETGTPDSPAPGPSPLPAPEASTPTTRWVLVRVSGASFTDEQAGALREQLADDNFTHVLVFKDGNETGSYTAFHAAGETVQKAGFPTVFTGRLLAGEKALTYAAVACRSGGLDDPLDLLQQVLGWGTGATEEIPV